MSISQPSRSRMASASGGPAPSAPALRPSRPRSDGMRSPLARKLFAIDGVASVFFGNDFVTVRKADEADWAVLKPQVFASIMDFYASGERVLLEGEALAADASAVHEDDSETVAMIKELIETRIRPAVAEDGGDILFRSFDEASGTVKVKLMGSCSGCPSSSITLKSGIENMLMHYVAEVKAVVADEEPDELEKLNGDAFKKLEAQLSP